MLAIPGDLAQIALNGAPDAMIIIDGEGIIRFANQQVSALFGYPHDEIVGRPVEALMPERFGHGHIAHRQRYTRSGQARPMGAGLELFGRRRDGSEFPVEISLSPIQRREGILVSAAIRDVTDRKRVEHELIEARKAAEHAREHAENAREAAEVARQAADRAKDVADEARASADRANQGKSRFLATASHDLRQPLQTLSLLNGALQRVVKDAEQAEVLAQQDQAIGSMARLLNALLDISKLESGAIKPDPRDFSVASLFRELRAQFSSLAAAKGLQLQIDESEDSVHSDRALVEQVISNLLSNAIKYTRQGHVALRCRHYLPSTVTVEVLDTGIGIPADQIRFIYDEFYQVGVPANSSREGYGLGLSIVQRIVRLLDVRIDVRSEVGKGSVFSLVLPTAESSACRTGGALQGTSGAGPSKTLQPRILLIDDDPGVLAATRMLLKVEGYRVTAVSSVADALQQLEAAGPIDLLVTDYHLANGENGTDAIARVRERLGLPVNAVLITGDTSSVVKELALDTHVRVASKPIRADELMAVIGELLGA